MYAATASATKKNYLWKKNDNGKPDKLEAHWQK